MCNFLLGDEWEQKFDNKLAAEVNEAKKTLENPQEADKWYGCIHVAPVIKQKVCGCCGTQWSTGQEMFQCVSAVCDHWECKICGKRDSMWCKCCREKVSGKKNSY